MNKKLLNTMCNMAQRYGYTYKEINNDLYITSSMCDEWLVYQDDRKLILKHKNTKYKINDFHRHAIVGINNPIHIFQKIKSHDNHVLKWRGRRKFNKVVNVLDKIKNNDVPYIKIS